MKFTCFECGQAITAAELSELGDVYIAHARVVHDWPYAEQGIRNHAEATQRLTGPSERLDTLEEPIIHPVTEIGSMTGSPFSTMTPSWECRGGRAVTAWLLTREGIRSRTQLIGA